MIPVVGINGHSWMRSSGDAGLARVLRALDGDRWYSLVLWLADPAVRFEDYSPADDVQEYLSHPFEELDRQGGMRWRPTSATARLVVTHNRSPEPVWLGFRVGQLKASAIAVVDPGQ